MISPLTMGIASMAVRKIVKQCLDLSAWSIKPYLFARLFAEMALSLLMSSAIWEV